MPLAKALEVWTAQTICDLGILLSIVAFLFHIGRPYFERILSRLTLRVAADLWWIAYVVMRDGLLLIAFLFGFLSLNMDLMADIKVGLPFVPLATVMIAVVLVIKVFANTEDVNAAYRTTTVLTSIAAFLNTAGYVLVMEAPGNEYAAAGTMFWQAMRSLRSNANPELSAWTFYLAILALGGVACYATVKALGMIGGGSGPKGGATCTDSR